MKNKQKLFASQKTGARGSAVDEPLSWAEEYPIQWRDPRVDLAELAKLRWITGWTTKEFAKKFGRTEVAIGNYFQALRRKGFNVIGLVAADRDRILAVESQKGFRT